MQLQPLLEARGYHILDILTFQRVTRAQIFQQGITENCPRFTKLTLLKEAEHLRDKPFAIIDHSTLDDLYWLIKCIEKPPKDRSCLPPNTVVASLSPFCCSQPCVRYKPLSQMQVTGDTIARPFADVPVELASETIHEIRLRT